LFLQEHEVDSAIALIKFLPSSVFNFVSQMQAAALTELPGIERVKILTLGNQRYCRRRRAEAIMAVLGVRDWFNQDGNTPSSAGDLVLGRYPMSFIREVRKKLGDKDFFRGNIGRDFWAQLRHDEAFEPQVEKHQVRGTLLPFSDCESTHSRRVSRDIRIWMNG